jgi:hypothetical protein
MKNNPVTKRMTFTKLGVGNGAKTAARNTSRKPRVDMVFLLGT